MKALYSRLISSEFVSDAGFRAYDYLKNENNYLMSGTDLRTDDFLSNIGLESHISEDKLKGQVFIGSQAISNRFNDKYFVLIELETRGTVVWGLEPIWHNSRVIGLVRKSFYSHLAQNMMSFGVVYKNRLIAEDLPSNVEIEVLGKLFNAKIKRIKANS